MAPRADQHMRAEIVFCQRDADFGLGLPVQRQIEVAGKDLPARTIVELDDVALGMRPDLHGGRYPFRRYF